MTRTLLALLSRIDRGDFSAVAPAVRQLAAERYGTDANALSRVNVVPPRGRGAAWCLMRPGGRGPGSPVAIWEFPSREAAEKAACEWVSSMIPQSERTVTPTTYPLLPTLDLPAIHYAAAQCVPACVDWLQEVVGIDLGNLLWAFARAEGDAVEPMQRVLGEWLRCVGDNRAESVLAFFVEDLGREGGRVWGGPGSPALLCTSLDLARRAMQLPILAKFDEDVRLLVAEVRPVDLWAKWCTPTGEMGTIGRLMTDVLRPFGFLVDFIGWELTIPNLHTNEPTKMIRQVLLPSQFLSSEFGPSPLRDAFGPYQTMQELERMLETHGRLQP